MTTQELETENARLREQLGKTLAREAEAMRMGALVSAERDEARHHADVAELDVSALHQQLEAARTALADAQRVAFEAGHAAGYEAGGWPENMALSSEEAFAAWQARAEAADRHPLRQ